MGDDETIKLRGKIEMRIDEASNRLGKSIAKARDLSFTLRRISDALAEPGTEKLANRIQSLLAILKIEGINWNDLTEENLTGLWQKILQGDNDLRQAKKEKVEFLGKQE